MEKPAKTPRNADKRHFKFTFNFLIAILLLLISFAMAGLFSWAIGGFRPDPLRSDEFWFSLIISTIINLFALMSSVTYELPNQQEKNPLILDRESALLEFNVTSDATKLEQFVIDKNTERKRLVYVNGIKAQRQKFIRKYKPSLEDLKCWHRGSDEQKSKNEYCIRLAEYDYLASDTYIEENLAYMNIKYPAITAGMIVSESMAQSGGLGYIHKGYQKTAWWALHTIPRYLANMTLAIAWAVFFIQMRDDIDAKFWLDFLVRLVGMLLNIATGFYLVRAYIKHIVVGDLDFRLSLVRQYVLWDIKKTPPVPETEKIIENINTNV